MARSGGRRSGTAGGARVAASDADRIIDAAVVLIARDGWRRLSLATVASEAELPLLRVYRVFPSTAAILCGLMRRVDEAVLGAPPEAEPDERPRDRVFDLLMRRFDALLPYRPALSVLRRELPFDPPSALAVGCALGGSMRWMLDAAGIATGGIGGALALNLTLAAYAAAAQTWARDDSPDLAPTMAALDRRLRGIERWLRPARRPVEGAAPADA